MADSQRPHTHALRAPRRLPSRQGSQQAQDSLFHGRPSPASVRLPITLEPQPMFSQRPAPRSHGTPSSSSAQHPSTEYLFVPLSGQRKERQDHGTKRSMRVHVMNDYRSKKYSKKYSTAMSISGEETSIDIGSGGAAQSSDTKLISGSRSRFRLSPALQRAVRTQSKSVKAKKKLQAQSHHVGNAGPEETSFDLSLAQRSTAETPGHRIRQPYEPNLQYSCEGVRNSFGIFAFQLSAWDETFLNCQGHDEQTSWCQPYQPSLLLPFALHGNLILNLTKVSRMVYFQRQTPGKHVERFMDKNPCILEYKLALIRLISIRLSNSATASADEVLGAIAVLVNIDLAFGANDEAAKHMAGLSTLVEMRGGISNLAGDIRYFLHGLISPNESSFTGSFDKPSHFGPIPTSRLTIHPIMLTPEGGYMPVSDPIEQCTGEQLGHQVTCPLSEA